MLLLIALITSTLLSASEVSNQMKYITALYADLISSGFNEAEAARGILAIEREKWGWGEHKEIDRRDAPVKRSLMVHKHIFGFRTLTNKTPSSSS